jgi:hypothetical protein
LSRRGHSSERSYAWAGSDSRGFRGKQVIVLQRLDWRGVPVELGDLFNLDTYRGTAICRLRSHPLGWELQLAVGPQLEVVLTQVCESQDEVVTTGDRWKAKLIEIRWV